MAKRRWTIEVTLFGGGVAPHEVDRPDCPVYIADGHLMIESGPQTVVAAYAPGRWDRVKVAPGRHV